MKKLIGLLFGLVAIVALISCGGGGGSSPLSPAGRAVQNIQRFSFLSMANSGLGFMGFGGGGGTTGSGTTGGSSTGGGGGVASIGGFVRNFGGAIPNIVHRLGEGTTGSGTTGSVTTGDTTGDTTGGEGTTGTTGGGGTGDYFYYDGWLQLWVDTHWTETTFNSNFYQDQEKTQPAGHISSVFESNWEVFPQIYSSDYEFTAGTLAGSFGTYNCTQTSPTDGGMTYQNHYSDGSHDHGSANWTEAGSSWSWRWDGADGSWYQDSGSWSPKGGDYSSSNSQGWSSTWHYNPDWSGYAHFEGPDPKLPADMSWTATGHYRIVYADGSVEEWNWEDLWGGNGESTTGSTGAGGFRPQLVRRR